jgi:hypothetical protein
MSKLVKNKYGFNVIQKVNVCSVYLKLLSFVVMIIKNVYKIIYNVFLCLLTRAV